MSLRPPIRVLSDLHLAHPASLIADIRQIEPLLEGAQTVVFNGDTVELRLKRVKARALRFLDELAELCRSAGTEPVFINGNHDPDASGLDHLDLMDGRLLVTHGHGLFPAITPWGRDGASLRKAHLRALEELTGEAVHRMEERLEAARRACLWAPESNGKIPETKLQWLAAACSEMAHPRRGLEVLRAWATVPALAAAFAARHRPRARCIILGHTHFPGRWMRGDTLVLNTGAYMPWLGRRVVDIFEDSLCMRTVVREGRSFRPGKEVVRRELKAEEPEPGNAAVPRMDSDF